MESVKTTQSAKRLCYRPSTERAIGSSRQERDGTTFEIPNHESRFESNVNFIVDLKLGPNKRSVMAPI